MAGKSLSFTLFARKLNLNSTKVIRFRFLNISNFMTSKNMTNKPDSSHTKLFNYDICLYDICRS